MKRHFPPVVDERTRVLILGSLPGDASLTAGQYYAHPRNAFWRLIGGLTGQDLASMPYADRLEGLRRVGIGLWDVVAQAERIGSLDSAIRASQPADLEGLIDTLPSLRAVAFNGKTAAGKGRRLLSHRHDLTLIDLPSSSPALVKPLAWKAQSWTVLGQYLSPPPDHT